MLLALRHSTWRSSCGGVSGQRPPRSSALNGRLSMGLKGLEG
jgi:hypothetical protein